MPSQALPGFRDFYPDDAALRNHIFAVWREVAARYGFEEYDGPPLEPLELYTAKSGEEIVEQLYAFEDKGGRQVALRPEMTPTLARMVAAHAQALKKPIRWFSIPQLFRYERQQRGRLREHFQLNMDIIGEAGPLADAELIAAAVDIGRALGLDATALRARVSDRRVLGALLTAIGLDAAQIPIAHAHIDKLEREPREVLVDKLRDALKCSKAEAKRVLELGALQGLEAVGAALNDVGAATDMADELTRCVAALDAMGLSAFVEVDLSIVRGLAYYTGVVFELFDVERSLRAICGGGRYDDLLSSVGGADLPAAGFGMGDVVLSELLRKRKAQPVHKARLDTFLVAVDAADVPTVLALAHELRDFGLGAEFALKEQSVAKQLKLAAARSARYAVIVGPDERAQGLVVLRDLDVGSEVKVPQDRLVQKVRSKSEE